MFGRNVESLKLRIASREWYWQRQVSFTFTAVACAVLIGILSGCGTTKWSDTGRTATEQLLITSAMDDVVDEFNFYPLSGRKLYINKAGVTCTDSQYLISILRQQLAANGVLVKDKEEEADYILEIAPGAAGTNRYDLMYGIPKTEIPSIVTGGTMSAIPELALIKRTDQKAQVKLMLWAYNKKNGAIIWQSGNKTKTAELRNRWILGFGPITRASFNKKVQVGGDDLNIPGSTPGSCNVQGEKPSVQSEAIYCEIDQKSIERLAAIREEGKYRLQKDTIKDELAKAKDNSTSSKKDSSQTETAESTSKPAHDDKKDKVEIATPPRDAKLSSVQPQAPSQAPSQVAQAPTTVPIGVATSGQQTATPELQFEGMRMGLKSVVVPQ